MNNEFRDKQILIPCIEIHQPIGLFYVGVIDSQDLLNITAADLTKSKLENYLGIESDLSSERMLEFDKYVISDDATYPTSIVLNVSSGRAKFTPTLADNIYLESRIGILQVDDDPNVAQIIDGRYRIESLRMTTNRPFQISVSIFADMGMEDQAAVFAALNLAQSKQNQSMIYHIYQYTKSRSPQKTAYNIVRLLNTKSGSPFYGHIKTLGTADPTEQLRGTITQAVFIDEIVVLISGDTEQAMEDREILAHGKTPSVTRMHERYELIFRDMFLQQRDEDIALVLWNYFGAVRQRWNAAWEHPELGYALRTIGGFKALMHFLQVIYPSLAVSDEVPTKSQFYTLLLGIDLKEIELQRGRYRHDDIEKKLFEELVSRLEGEVSAFSR